ncbi:heavy-metal-associated domain-containing protein [bacterium]|jgi:copper chaperone CopZ|nr:heavy-metal-associated domain-containing protein [Flavobacteriaceae bacterium]MDA9642760.1 heavy-metal-associated domain-containing protein [bacterium]
MKKILLIMLITLPLALSGQSKGKKNTKATFEVSGNCEMCQKRILKAAFSVKGVKMANWDIPSHLMSVIYDSNKISLDSLQHTIALAGHDTPLVKAIETTYDKLPMCCLYERMTIVKN